MPPLAGAANQAGALALQPVTLLVEIFLSLIERPLTVEVYSCYG